MLAIQLHSITKRFGNILANDAAELRVKLGEIHALVGENGAGKTTLMKTLYGMHQPDGGEIIINGRQEHIESPAKAIKLGLGMVHQHFMLIPPLTTTENIILGEEPTTTLAVLDLKKAEADIRRLSETYRLSIDPTAKVETLSVGMQQRVEILKLLYRSADVLILDEPTPVLTPQEVDELFHTLRSLKEQGKTIILITHKLSEVMTISDTVTVMRHGRTVAELETKSTTKDELARLMVGKEIGFVAAKTPRQTTEPALIVDNVSALNDRGLTAVRNVSLTVARGEIFGIAGVEGNGQSELVQVVTGLRKVTGGRILIDDVDVTNRYPGSRVAHIPEDRIRRGLVLSFSLKENLILGRQREKTFTKSVLGRSTDSTPTQPSPRRVDLRSRRESSTFSTSREGGGQGRGMSLGVVSFNHPAIERYADTVIKQFDVRPRDKNLPARNLSGGNQQKLVIGREISKNATVIVASQPTRGLDIGATDFVHTTLLEERNKGKSILLVSSDLDELLLLSDRIGVMYEGELVAVFPAERTNEYELGLYMTGAKRA